jgi:hypothetical protein
MTSNLRGEGVRKVALDQTSDFLHIIDLKLKDWILNSAK